MSFSNLNSNEIDKTVYDATAEAKKVLLVDDSGTPYSASGGAASTYDVIIDKATTTDVIYIGKAAKGTATSSASWQIKKIDKTTTNVTAITWADNDSSFDNVWDNRASLTYG